MGKIYVVKTTPGRPQKMVLPVTNAVKWDGYVFEDRQAALRKAASLMLHSTGVSTWVGDSIHGGWVPWSMVEVFDD